MQFSLLQQWWVRTSVHMLLPVCSPSVTFTRLTDQAITLHKGNYKEKKIGQNMQLDEKLKLLTSFSDGLECNLKIKFSFCSIFREL